MTSEQVETIKMLKRNFRGRFAYEIDDYDSSLVNFEFVSETYFKSGTIYPDGKVTWH